MHQNTPPSEAELALNIPILLFILLATTMAGVRPMASALVACYLLARRAASIHPMQALRTE